MEKALWTHRGAKQKRSNIVARKQESRTKSARLKRAGGDNWSGRRSPTSLLDGDIEKLRNPNYHALNKHFGRNDRLLHAVLCAYVKHHFYEDNHIGWDELDAILLNAICNEIGDDAFCKWSQSLR